jgi:hypothetical protein
MVMMVITELEVNTDSKIFSKLKIFEMKYNEIIRECETEKQIQRPY